MPEKKTLNEDLFYKGSSASLPRLHTCENKVPFWDFKEFAVTIHTWATIGMDINKQDQCKYLLVVDYYSSISVVKILPDTSVTTVYEQFTQVLTAYGLPITIMADCGLQYMSERFKRECHNSNITYHYQTE